MVLFNILFFTGIVYAFAAAIISFIGFSQGWLKTSNQDVLSFRKPKLMRLGSGMIGLLCLCNPWIIMTDTKPSDIMLMWCTFGAVSIALFCLLSYLAGPQDVLINLNEKVCYGTAGWIFNPRKRICPLSDKSSVCVWASGHSWCVVLWIGGRKDPRFLLGLPSCKSEAITFAKNIACKLHLPVKETTLKEIRQLT